MIYYFGQPVRFVENNFIDVNPLSGKPTEDGSFVGYRTDYSDVEEIVDRKHWQPSSVAVSQVAKHSGMSRGLYDSPEVLKSAKVSAVNASIRHPSNDIVDLTNQLSQLKKITIEVAEADVKAQLEKAEAERRASMKTNVASNTPSTPPEATLGG